MTEMATNIPRYIDYYQGKQWGKVEKGTEQMPRLVFNVLKMIGRNKKANMVSVPCRLVYKSEIDSERAEMFTRFAEWWTKDARADEIDNQAIEDGFTTGGYFFHYYWDNEATSKRGDVVGGCRVELIDILDIFFANPCEEDEQKQEWILIRSRENVEAVKEMADDDIDIELIKSDKSESKYNDKEQDGTELCTILTRYYKENGEVFCERAVKGTMVNKAFSITPSAYMGNEEEDTSNTALADKPEFSPSRRKASLYPIVCGSYDRRKNSIYGIGEIETLTANQDAINIIASMQVYNVMVNAWGKWKVTPDALNGQEITNEVGQVLTDYSKDHNGISRIQESGFSSAPSSVMSDLMSTTRAVAGATEVLNGEVLGANMSGTAIAQLQAQASQPIEELRNRYWRVKEKQGKVLEQFFRLYYADQEFTYETIDGTEHSAITAVFSGGDYDDIALDLVVEACGGTRSSSAGDIYFLDTLLSKGAITVKQYVQMYPNDAVSNKADIMRVLDQQEQDKVAQLSGQLEQTTAQLQQLAQVVQQQNKAIDSVSKIIAENRELRSVMSMLYQESISKIDQANQMASEYQQVNNDATYLAAQLQKQKYASNSEKMQ
jgi:hypothetical protein